MFSLDYHRLTIQTKLRREAGSIFRASRYLLYTELKFHPFKRIYIFYHSSAFSNLCLNNSSYSSFILNKPKESFFYIIYIYIGKGLHYNPTKAWKISFLVSRSRSYSHRSIKTGHPLFVSFNPPTLPRFRLSRLPDEISRFLVLLSLSPPLPLLPPRISR